MTAEPVVTDEEATLALKEATPATAEINIKLANT